MRITLYLFIAISIFFNLACTVQNPAAKGFLKSQSDQKAIEIADKVMEAMGGRKNWDATNYISWDFFGSRKLLWSKHSGDVLVDYQKKDLEILVNIHTLKGKVKKDGEILTHPDSLSKYLQIGKEAWINDSYWLVMPFKLKDSGVKLTYVAQQKDEEGTLCDVLQLTYENVGVTPENKYQVWVNSKTNLISQWSFYSKYDDTEPRFITPWKGYKKYENILLADDRGKYKLTEIQVFNTNMIIDFGSLKSLNVK